MKKNLFYLFALVCAMSLFTSCGSDDDEKNDPFGTYSGALKVEGASEAPITTTESVQLTKDGADNKFSFLLKNFMIPLGGASAEPTPVGTIDIENVELVASGTNKYTFSKQITGLKIIKGDKEGISESSWIGPNLPAIDVKLNGTIDGDKVNVKLEMNVLGMNIAVSFVGNK